MVTQEDVKNVLDYNQETGVFTWKNRNNNSHLSGKVAGSKVKKGYLIIGINKTRYYAHRLAWLYVNGVMPINQIDHIDGNKTNNSISNLRDIESQKNSMNQRKPSKGNTTGFLGVTLEKKTGKYQAQIMLDGRHIYIGRFNDAIDAHNAYLSKKREVHSSCTI